MRGRARLVAAGVVAWTLAPVAWAVVCSVKRPVDVFSLAVIPFLQFAPTFDHWREELVTRGPEIRGGLLHSALAAVGSALLAVALAAPAAYALARLVPPARRRAWWVWLVSQRFLPPVVLLVPYFLALKAIGLLDSVAALVLVHAASSAPFAALVLTDAFGDLPPELEEAAAVDGAGIWQTFALVALPLAAPALAAAFVLCAAFSWNEFLLALTLTYTRAVTMPVVIAGTEHTQGVQFWYVATRSLVALGPPAVLALFVQRYLVRGLTLGAVKG